MTPEQMTRQFALKLHSLHDDDRTWILNQLDDVTSQEFKSLLRELEEIGLEPGSPLSLIEGESDNQTRYIPENPYGSGRLESILATACQSTIEYVLKDEPPVLRNICMQLYPWSWMNNKSNQQSTIDGSVIPDSSGKYTPKVRQALVRVLANRIQLAPKLACNELVSSRTRQRNTSSNSTTMKRMAKKLGILRGYLPWRR